MVWVIRSRVWQKNEQVFTGSANRVMTPPQRTTVSNIGGFPFFLSLLVSIFSIFVHKNPENTQTMIIHAVIPVFWRGWVLVSIPWHNLVYNSRRNGNLKTCTTHVLTFWLCSRRLLPQLCFPAIAFYYGPAFPWRKTPCPPFFLLLANMYTYIRIALFPFCVWLLYVRDSASSVYCSGVKGKKKRRAGGLLWWSSMVLKLGEWFGFSKVGGFYGKGGVSLSFFCSTPV